MSEGASSGCCSTAKGYEGVLFKMNLREDSPLMSESSVVLDAKNGKVIITNKKNESSVKIPLRHTTVRKIVEEEYKLFNERQKRNASGSKNSSLPSPNRWLVIEHKTKKTFLVSQSPSDTEEWIGAIRRVMSAQKRASSASLSTSSDCSCVLDDDFDPFSDGRSTNYGYDKQQPQCPKNLPAFAPSNSLENKYPPAVDLCGYDEICYSTMCQYDHDFHGKTISRCAVLYVTRFRVMVKTAGTRNPVYDFHLWDLDMVRGDPERCSVVFTLSGNVNICVYVPSPSAITDVLFKSFSPIRIRWPQLGSAIPKWSYDFKAPVDGKQVKDPAIVYLAECSYVGKRANPAFILYLQTLFKNKDRHLDLSCVASSDDDVQTSLGMLEHDQFFLGVSTAKSPVKDIFSVAARVFKKNQTLTLLSLRDVGIDDSKQFSDFCATFQDVLYFNGLTWIDLSGNPLKDSGAKSFAGVIASFNHRFTHLDLANCQMSGKGLNAIFEAFTSNMRASVYLDYLDISGNKCDDSACAALDNWLAKAMANLTPEAKGLSTLKMASCRATFSSMKNLPNVTSLTDLDISDNKLGQTSSNIVSGLLRNVKSLRMLDCNIKKELHSRLVHDFLDVRKASSDLVLELSCVPQPKSEKNSVSSAQSCSIPSELFDKEMASKLSRLTLSNVSASCAHIDQLCRILAAAPHLGSLSIQNVSQDCFAVPGSCAMWGAALGFLVITNKVLTSLTLHNVPPDVVHTLLDRVSKSPCNLEHLNVGMCNLGDSGAFAVADALPNIESLRVVELDDNNIHVGGIHAIVCCLSHAPQIRQVCMEQDITREIVALNAKSPSLAAQCLQFAGALSVELNKNKTAHRKDQLSKRLSVIEGPATASYTSLLPREIRLITPISQPLPVADMPRTPDAVGKKSKHSFR